MITLPNYAKEILDKYLRPLNNGAPFETLLMSLNVECARVLCYNRVRITGLNVNIFPNIYGLTFTNSGAGKDRVNHHIRKLTKQIEIEWEEMENQQFNLKKAIVDREVDGLDLTAPAKEKLKRERYPRRLVRFMTDATPEGLLAMREEMSKGYFAGIHFQIAEFGDYIASRDKLKDYILTILKEVYEDGSSVKKVLKMDRVNDSADGVPQTMLAYTSPEMLLEDSVANITLKTFFDRGMARRCFICYPEDKKRYITYTFEEKYKRIEDAENQKQVMSKYFLEVNRLTKPFDVNTYKQITISMEAFRAFSDYEDYNKIEAEKLKQGCFKPELGDRHRKSLRIAGIIAAFEHPEKLEITTEDFELAIMQVEMFGEQFRKFYQRPVKSEVEQVYEYILDNQETSKISKSKLKGLQCAPKDNNKKVEWVDDLIEELVEFCEEKKSTLDIEEWQNGTIYKINKQEDNN